MIDEGNKNALRRVVYRTDSGCNRSTHFAVRIGIDGDGHAFEFFADFIRPVTEDGYDRFCTSVSEVVDAGFDYCFVPER